MPITDTLKSLRGSRFLFTFYFLDPSLTALANEVEALRAALLQKEQQVASLTSPIHPTFTTSGLPTTLGLVPPQTYVPHITTSGLATTPGLVPSQTYVPQITTSGLPSTPGLVATQTYVPRVVPGVAEGALNGTSSTRAVPAVSTLVTSSSGLGTNSHLVSPGEVHHHHHFRNKSRRGTTCLLQ